MFGWQMTGPAAVSVRQAGVWTGEKPRQARELALPLDLKPGSSKVSTRKTWVASPGQRSDGVGCCALLQTGVGQRGKGKAMLTQFRRRKLDKIFDLYDVNKDGYIDAADYARVGEGFGTATSSAPGTADNEKLRSTYLE